MVCRIPFAAAFLLACALASGASAGTRYVNVALTTGANNGTSWADAIQGVSGLHTALAISVAGDDIWVAQGTYKPSPTSNRSIYFVLRNNVGAYGGFVGTELTLDQRDWVANATILDGDLAGNDGSGIYTDNSYHVVDATGATSGAILDGFTVRGGNGNGVAGNLTDSGGGILCAGGATPTVRNCVFSENRCIWGGGASYAESASPTFLDCSFESNTSGGLGGALELYWYSNTTVRRCKFSGNSALDVGGAVQLFQGSTATLTECVFTGNSAPGGGAIDMFNDSDPKITNCVFWNNASTGTYGGGAISCYFDNPTITQCTIVGNPSYVPAGGGIVTNVPIFLANDVIYFNEGPGGAMGLVNNVSGANCGWCCVQGIVGGPGNISADPLFANIAAADLHLSQLSPCADAGHNSNVPQGTTTDLDGLPRFVDDPNVVDTGGGTAPIVDLGAYEIPYLLYSAFCAGDGTLATVCPCGNTGATGRGCRNSDLQSSGVLLAIAGSSTPDTLLLTASDLLPSVSCIFLQGDQAVSNGIVFGDGVRCVSGALKRLYLKFASGGTASAPEPGDPSVSARSAVLGDTITPGAQRYYQVYYRDPDPTFCPTPVGNGWNVSSGAIITW